MRSLSLVVIGLTLASTTAAAEPLRLADTDLDLVTADVRNISVLGQDVQSADYDGLDTNDTIIRILGNSDVDIALMDERSTTDPEAADGNLAVPVSNNDPGNAVGDSDVLIVRGDDLPGIGVVVSGTGVVLLDRGAIAGNDMSAAGTRTESRQVVVRTSSVDNGTVVRTTGSFTGTGSSDSIKGVSSGGGARSILVSNDNANGGASIRATSLLAGNGNAALSASRLDRGIAPGRFNASAFAGGAVASMLRGSFN